MHQSNNYEAMITQQLELAFLKLICKYQFSNTVDYI